MAIYEYNSSTINYYSTDDYGLISSSVDDYFDCGKIDNNFDHIQDFYTITCFETLVPFGSIKVKKTELDSYKKVSIEFDKLYKIYKKSIIFEGIILFWFGFGTVFEFNNGLKRQLIPDVSGGGNE